MRKSPGSVEIIPIRGIPLIKKGDDLCALIMDAISAQSEISGLQNGDIICIGQKIISKALGCAYYNLDEIKPTEEAQSLSSITGKDPKKVQMILDHSTRVIRVGKDLLVTENENQLVGANSGIDFSNTENPTYLHPNCDEIAKDLHEKFFKRTGVKMGIVITDSIGRAFRLGSVGFAAGSAGILALSDKRGQKDLFGVTLKHTYIGIADQLATIADAVMGQVNEAIPVVVIRNAWFVEFDEESKAKDLRRPVEMDTFIDPPWHYLFNYKINLNNNIDEDKNVALNLKDFLKIAQRIIISLNLTDDIDYTIEPSDKKNTFLLSIKNIKCFDRIQYELGRISASLCLYFRGLGIECECVPDEKGIEVALRMAKQRWNVSKIE